MPRPSLGVGDVVAGRFRLTAEIGEGGMGRVFEAEDGLHDRQAAVKVISRRLARDLEFRARFEREAKAAERANHPHVLPVWDYGAEGENLYMATPLCDADLAALLEDVGPLEPPAALRLIEQIAWALDWAHGRGVVHRDVKPENILVVRGPREAHAYLADFGMARVASSATLTQAGAPIGLSPAYAAPEQWLGETVGPATDQYALAATLYACLCGRPPFGIRTVTELREAHVHEQPPPPSGLAADDPVSRALLVGLAKDPGDRYPSCGELVAAVGDAATPVLPPQVGRAEGTDPRAQTVPEHPSSSGRAAPPAAPPAASVGRDEPLVAAAHTVTAPQTVAPPPAPPPAAPAPPSSPAPRRRRRAPLVALGAVALAAAAAAVVLVASGGGDTPEPATAGQATAAPSRLQHVPVGRRPVDVAAADGAIWVANSGSASVTRVGAGGGGAPRADSVPALDSPFGVAAGGGFVWVAGARGDILAIDAESGAKAGTITRADQTDGLALTSDAIWTFNGTGGTVTRMGVERGRELPGTRTTQVGPGLSDIAAGLGGVWVTNASAGTLVELDPADGKVVRTIPMHGAVDSVAVGEGAVWVANSERGTLVRVDPQDTTTVPVQVGKATEAADVAVGDGAVFYIDQGTGEATRIDPESGRPVGKATVVAKSPTSAVVAGHALWVTDGADNTLTRLPF
jgi:serine/threonine-protein kinase